MINSTLNRISWLFFLLIVSTACTPVTGIAQNNNRSSTATLSPSPPATVVPATSTPLATETPSSAAMSTATATVSPTVSILSIPTVDFANLSPYRQAMLPEFTGDVDAVAATGASHYYLEVSLIPDERTGNNRLTLEGIERVHYTNTEPVPLSDIYFRLYPNLPGFGGEMQIDALVVDNQPISLTLEANDSALRVSLPAPLLPGDVTDISLSYSATVPTEAELGYNIFSASDGTIALAGFFPIIAVYDENEGWDIEVPPPYGDATYLDIAFFKVNLTVPERMVIAASGSELNSALNNDGTKTVTIASGPMRDFYVAMREDYELVSEVVDGTTINSYYPADLEQGGQLALRYAADALDLFNQHFGRYPYAEFDVAATPTTAGGVEYPGIVVVNENAYTSEGGFFEHATVHEVAHQWWYGLVGNDQVEEPWLDEALTNYSTIIYWEEIRGEEAAENVISGLFLGPYEFAKEQGRDRAVIGPVSAFSEREYGAFVYGKGPLFFHALREEVGDETYFEIMQVYYDAYKYEIASAEDLFATIERVAGRNIEPLVETWLQEP